MNKRIIIISPFLGFERNTKENYSTTPAVGGGVGGGTGGGEDRTSFKSNPTIIPISPAVIASFIENPGLFFCFFLFNIS